MRRDCNDLEKHEDRSDRDRWPDQPSLDRGAGADPERSSRKRDAPASERPPPRDRNSESSTRQCDQDNAARRRVQRSGDRRPQRQEGERMRGPAGGFAHGCASGRLAHLAVVYPYAVAATACVTRSARTNTPTIRTGSPSTLVTLCSRPPRPHRPAAIRSRRAMLAQLEDGSRRMLRCLV
jgi:hypothetical protein